MGVPTNKNRELEPRYIRLPDGQVYLKFVDPEEEAMVEDTRGWDIESFRRALVRRLRTLDAALDEVNIPALAFTVIETFRPWEEGRDDPRLPSV